MAPSKRIAALLCITIDWTAMPRCRSKQPSRTKIFRRRDRANVAAFEEIVGDAEIKIDVIIEAPSEDLAEEVPIG